MRGRLPDFIIVGGIRCGTTSLFRYLDAHDRVFMARGKELRFFNVNYDRGVDWYTSKFADAGDNQLCGEATPAYMSNSVAVERLASLVPDARLIISLRNPVDRAWSDYWMMRERGKEKRSFRTAVEDEISAIRSPLQDHAGLRYVWNGLYDRHLTNLLGFFDREQILVCVFERMVGDPETTYKEVCHFLKLEVEDLPPNLGDRVNPYVSFRSVRLRRLAKRLPRQVERAVASFNTRKSVSYPPLPDGDRQYLNEFYGGRIDELEETLGMSLSELR